MSDTKNNDLTTKSVGIDYSTLVNIDTITDVVGQSTGAVLSGGFTDDLQPTLSGHIPYSEGYQLRVFLNGSVVGYSKVDGDANWSFTPETPLEPGMTCDFQVVLIDAGTNTLYPSTIYTIHTTELNHDTPPHAPVITEVHDDAGMYQGDVAQGGKTDDSQPLISGTADAGSIVTVTALSPAGVMMELGSIVTDSNGHWSYQFEGKQNISLQGEWTFTATASNEAGVSADSAGYSVESVASNGDAFTAPVITSLTDDVGLYQGEVNNGGATDDKKPGLHGTGEPGSIITITMHGPVSHELHNIAQVEVGRDGTWSYQFTGKQALQKGDNIFHVSAKDSVGHEATGSDFVVTLTGSNHDDITPPDAPVITDVYDDVGVQQGPVANGAKTDDSLLLISGTAEAGSTVTISHVYEVTGVEYPDGTVLADASGHWTFQMTGPFQPSFGNRTITATATDAAGNVSVASDSYVVNYVEANREDTTAPDAPVINSFYDGVGHIKGNMTSGKYTDDTTPTLNGHAEANSVVKVYEGSTLVGSATADKNGDWSFTSTGLNEGHHSFTATATDIAGNVSKMSGQIEINIDTHIFAPVITQVVDDQGTTTGPVAQGGKTDDTTLTLHGTAEADSVISLWVRGPQWGKHSLGTVIADHDGNWTINPTLPSSSSGKWSFYATATDPAGNTSLNSSSYVVRLTHSGLDDITAPDVPVLNEVHDNAGVIHTGALINETTPVLNGQAEANSTVKIYDGNSAIGSVTADAKGNWSFTPAPLRDGEHNLTITATDAAGNVSGKTAGFLINVDTENATPVVLGLDDERGTFTGLVEDGGKTDVSQAMLTGTAEPDSIIHVKRQGPQTAITYSVQTDHDGHWQLSQEFSYQGTFTYAVWSADTAGNNSEHTHYTIHRVHYNQDGSSATLSLEHAVLPESLHTTNLEQAHVTTPASLTEAQQQMLEQHSQIDLHNGVQDKLVLSLQDILSEAHSNLFTEDGKQQLAITGDQGDVVELKVEDLSHNTWQDAGQVTAGGIQYEVYQHTAADVELLVQHGLELHQVV
ncbi:Ig-like domain-containing protein [Rahnella bruchi]|uniref:Ig-like domain-containing protein n=1 Tax=Rahnella bruchi TaxID=1510573 RepID=UPI000EA13AA5|nr:Ig-like domain-containing protein [Rahnella bruchi]